VSAALNDSKAITAYSFTAVNPGLDSTVTGTITGTDISVTVPYGTDISSLIADFTTTGESVTANGNPQFSGNTPNDFTSPVTYIVTAEDGSTRDYTVTVLQRAIEGSGFNEASEPGDSGLVRFGKTLTMIYVQNQASIDFPTDTDDSPSVELTTRFWMGETEVTNAVMAVVLQWAYDEGLFSDTVSDSNGIGINTVKYGGQELLDLDDSDCRVDYDGFGIFSAESSFEEHPVTDITWFGAVMFCNWLTEMRDGNADNVVYIWTDNGDGDGTASDGIWQDDETDIDTTKNGYRLPSSDEWEYTARYRGSDSTNTVSGYSNPYFTKGDSASGAYTYYNDEADVNPANGVVDGKDANDQVAVYGYYWDGSNWVDTGTTDEAEVKSLGPSSANTLGLYDMSGNVWEWCYTEYNSFRILRGGSWGNYTSSLEIGYWNFGSSVYSDHLLGFRLCRTAD
jgi:formylglycine-generating enzyme required for sulfatase activity